MKYRKQIAEHHGLKDRTNDQENDGATLDLLCSVAPRAADGWTNAVVVNNAGDVIEGVRSKTLTADQKQMIRATMAEQKDKRLRDAGVQLATLRRIEGAMAQISGKPVTSAATARDKADELARALTRAKAAFDAVPENVADMLDLTHGNFKAAIDGLHKSAGDLADGLKAGRGESYGDNSDKAKARFIASQIADVFRLHGVPTSHKSESAFFRVVNVALGQIAFPELGEDALRRIVKGG